MKELREFVDRAQAWIDAHTEELISDLQDFARIRSVSRADLAAPGMPFGEECAAMLAFALQRGRDYGFDAADHAGFCGSICMNDPNNAIGIFAHLDVVPEGDKWIYPPYGATRAGDFLIGRGVADNKAAAVTALYLMRMFRDMGIELRHGVRLVLGLSEETGMKDMEHFVAHETLPVVSLIPDAGFPVNFAQKGTLRGKIEIAAGEQIAEFAGGEADNMVPPHAHAVVLIDTDLVRVAFEKLGMPDGEFDITPVDGGTRVTAHGIAAHAAAPQNGKSAIHSLAAALAGSGLMLSNSQVAMDAIKLMTGDYYGANAGIDCEDPETGKTTMVLGVAKSCDGQIRLHLDCRLSIATDVDQAEQSFIRYARSLGFSVEETGTTRPVYLPKDDPRVTALQSLYAEITGDGTEPYAMGGGTYARVIPNALTFGLGLPGSQHRPDDLPENHGGAHAPDEYLHLPSLMKAFAIYAAAVMTLDELI